MSAYRGELEVIVTSAEALDSKSMSRLEKALKGSQLAEGKTLKINNKVGHWSMAVYMMAVHLANNADCQGQPQSSWWSLGRLWRQDK
jgi:hypothetical protein